MNSDIYNILSAVRRQFVHTASRSHAHTRQTHVTKTRESWLPVSLCVLITVSLCLTCYSVTLTLLDQFIWGVIPASFFCIATSGLGKNERNKLSSREQKTSAWCQTLAVTDLVQSTASGH
ncbi:uncharacterized protein LOC131943510 [Physella acuta]|uniref:uncharacterized protein LOC131943510 n=1 Tax=Physella acuta TaxID=109671 RepID=UPI0027DCDAE4|nr:uncharacterized protein LOC131943510 [Physella acuta]